MERLRVETYKGKEILINDTSNLSSEGFIDQMRKFQDYVFKTKKQNLRVVSDIRGSSITHPLFNELKNIASKTKPYVYKYAVVGVTNPFHKVLTTIKKFAVKYLEKKDTIEEVMEWLSD